jgi:alpha-L-rhamnosidase
LVKRIRFVFLFAIQILILGTLAFAAPVRLRSEYLVNPLGIDAATPHLSWQNDSPDRDWKQVAYQVMVASSAEKLASQNADVWDSGRKESDDSIGIAYGGPKLASRHRYYWKVRVWDSAGQIAESTESAWWEMGLLDPSDWKAKWISWRNPESEADRAGIRWIWAPGQDAFAMPPKTSALFQSKVKILNKPRGAELFVAVRGDYSAKVNGHEVGKKARWEAFDRCDITDQLVVGENVIEVKVESPEAPDDAKTVTAAFAGLVKITETNGSTVRFSTDSGWKARLESDSQWRDAKVLGDLTDRRLGDPGPLPQPAAYLRGILTVSKPVQSARLYVTALGSYRAFINGKSVGSDVMTPDFTDYRKRVLYQTYDVTSLITQGRNVVSAILGDGWYGSPLTWAGAHFFTPPDRLRAQLEIDHADGSREVFVSSSSWKAIASPIVESQLYSGETYDARLEQSGWQKSEFNDSRWRAAVVADSPSIAVSSQITSPVQVVAAIGAKSVTPLPSGAYVYDFGQNMVGWVQLRVKGAAGNKIRMRFAEILSPDGSIYTENLRNADATDTYILRGGEEETFTPHFTFHGFRYVEVTGYPGTPQLDSLKGEVVSSISGDPVAQLSTSSDLVNHMWSIGIWGQRGNFLSIPTDCPQRDERLGWMGDAGVFWRTGSFNFDIASFSRKFVQDTVDAQTRAGAFTNVSPNSMPFDGEGGASEVGAPGWGDAGVIVPWTAWVQYGDKSMVEESWGAMQRWMDFIANKNPDYLRRNGVGPNYADWLAPDENTDKDLLATAYWALIANMMEQMAHATGKDADAKRYDDLLQNIRSAFQKAYIKDDGTVGTGTQTSYVVALYTKLAPNALEPVLVEKLVNDIRARNWHLSTGFLGTPFLLFTLADHGRTDVAYRLLLNDSYPSWGYMLAKGATTWWERWNGDTGDPSMNSYNHYAFGSVVAWAYRDLAGIDTSLTGPGYKKIVIHPRPNARVTSARGEYESVYGKIVSDWQGTPNGPFVLKVTIPANTSADVFLPGLGTGHVTEDGQAIQPHHEDGWYVVPVGSGSYSFEVK